MSANSTSTVTPRKFSSGGYAPLDAKLQAKMAAAGVDLVSGLRRYGSARYLAMEAMKNQYRRTVLGPWWVTLQSAVLMVGLAVIFGQLQGKTTKEFLPFVASGYLFFIVAQGVVRASAFVFVTGAGTITSSRQPLMGLALRDITVEFLQFGHNAVILLALYPLRLLDPSWTVAFVPLILVATAMNGLALAGWLGPLVARYRDVGPAVMSVLQVAIFFTPVFYASRGLKGGAELMVQLNPFAYFIDLFRSSMLGMVPSGKDVAVVAGVTVVNCLLGAAVFSQVRSRIPYWVS